MKFLYSLTFLICLSFAAADFIEGKYKLVESTNFQAYIRKLKVNQILAAAAGNLKPEVTITRGCDNKADDCFIITTNVFIKEHKIQFKLGVPVDDTTLDSREVQTTFNLFPGDDNILIESQRGEVDNILTRVFSEDGMVIRLVARDQDGEVEATAYYSRIA